MFIHLFKRRRCLVQKGLIMLRAIAQNGTTAVLNINDDEYLLADVPNGLLTDDELRQVRNISPDALPGYIPFQDEDP